MLPSQQKLNEVHRLQSELQTLKANLKKVSKDWEDYKNSPVPQGRTIGEQLEQHESSRQRLASFSAECATLEQQIATLEESIPPAIAQFRQLEIKDRKDLQILDMVKQINVLMAEQAKIAYKLITEYGINPNLWLSIYSEKLGVGATSDRFEPSAFHSVGYDPRQLLGNNTQTDYTAEIKAVKANPDKALAEVSA